jgi:hypothetical protein
MDHDNVSFRFEGGNRTQTLRGDSTKYMERDQVNRYLSSSQGGRVGAQFWVMEEGALSTHSEKYEVVDRVTDDRGQVTIVCRFAGVSVV